MDPVQTPPESAQPEPTDPQVVQDGQSTLPPSLQPGQKNKKLVKILAGLLLVVVVAVAGFFGYKALTGEDAAPQAEVKKEIPLVTLGYQLFGSDNSLYPAATLLDPNYDVNQQVFEGLTQFKNLNQIKPLLAASWTNPDDNTWDFKLEKNVKFHTGRIMTAADVKYSLENFNTGDYGKTYGSTIKGVEIVNDYEVKVTTNGPDPLLLNKLAYLFIIDSQSELQNDARNGTGPYTLKEGTTPSEKELDLVAFDDWHGGRPLTRALNFKVFELEEEQMAALEKGELNVAGEFFEKKNETALENTHKYQNIYFPHVGVSGFRINSQKPGTPLANAKVRQALYASLDSASLMEARGIDGKVANQIVPVDVPGFNPDIPEHKRDIEKAKALLAEAGYPDGVNLEFVNFGVPSGLREEVIKETKDAGFTITIKTYDDLSLEEGDIAAGKLQFWGYSISTNLLDASDVVAAYLQGQDYDNPAVNDLAAQASKTLDPAKRLKLLQEISKALVDDVAFIPLFSRVQHYYTDPSFVITRDIGSASLGVNFANVYAK